MKMDPLSLHAIESFIKKNQIANQSQSKEVRISIKEMNELSVSLASVMTRLMMLTDSNAALVLQLNQLNLQLNTGNIDLDGGGFRKCHRQH